MNFLSNKVYDALKYVAQIVLPAVGTLYFSLAGFWNLPFPEEVVGSVMAFDAFLGVLLGLSTASYNKAIPGFDGTLIVDSEDKELKSMSLALNKTPDEIKAQDQATFKVE